MARKLTEKQSAYYNARIDGHKPYDAYVVAYSTSGMGQASISVEANNLENHPVISLMLKDFFEKRQQCIEKKILLTTERLVEAFMYEAGIGKVGAPEDTTQSSRVSALKVLTDYTGGFDKNRKEDKKESEIHIHIDGKAALL